MFKKIALSISILFISFLTWGCEKKPTNQITIYAETFMKCNTTQTISVDLSSGEYTLTTSNPAILEIIDNTTIKGNGPGKAILTAIGPNNLKAELEISVRPTVNWPVSKIMQVGDTQAVRLYFSPSTAVEEYIITSSDENIVTVSPDASLIEAKGMGTATLTLTTNSGATATATITVPSPHIEYKIEYDLTDEEKLLMPNDYPTIFSRSTLPLELPILSNAPYELIGWQIFPDGGATDGELYFSIPTTIVSDVVVKPVFGVTWIEIYYEEGTPLVAVDDEIRLKLKMFAIPGNINQEMVRWTSSNEEIATVTNTGYVVGHSNGYVEITVELLEMPHINMTIGVVVMDTLNEMDELLTYFIDNSINRSLSQNIRVSGYQSPGFYYKKLLGSVTNYLFAEHRVEEAIVPFGKGNRSGNIYDKYYIVVHDTASIASSGDAYNHSEYVKDGGGGTSWHYSVGDDMIYHQIPDNEEAYHAGDGGRSYTLTNSDILAGLANPKVTISPDGYYVLNGQKSSVLAPRYQVREKDANGNYVYENGKYKYRIDRLATTGDINDHSVRVVIKDGYYYIGNTYFNDTYLKVSNGGGNRNSIGIESMVNAGSDIYLTWQKLAKLVSHLIVDNNLTIDDVKPHHFFSGKNCPQTMRDNTLWNQFMTLVEMEYKILTEYSDYQITFTSHNPEYLDNSGRVIKEPFYAKNVSYTITVTKDGVNKSITMSTVIPGSSQLS